VSWRAPWLALAAAVVAAGAPLGAQSYFGQNQVQYQTFHWQIKETEHFLIHYYPEERVAAEDAARMAERAYARLSRVMNHQFREKKPIILYSSRPDFGQNNVTGDLGEGTGGVTEASRHRILVNFTGDYGSFQHVLTHEMVHVFQYDIFAHGKAGNGLQALAAFEPPLWFAEGMAEYLSIGPQSTFNDSWMRDAALNGTMPTVAQMTDHPDQFNPYRFGESFWEFVGQQFGDESIGQIMNSVPSVGVERAFNRELGESLDDIADEWRETVKQVLAPQVATQNWPRTFATALLTPRKSHGDIFLAPAFTSDGKLIAFLSNGDVARGQVFIDLWLGDGTTGQRIDRLAEGTTTEFEEFRVLYSQPSFSPDGRRIAFTAQTGGRDVLYVMDVSTRKKIRLKLPLTSVTGPSWSPDGAQLVISGGNGGVTDLYVVDADGSHLRQLTNDRFGDLQPQWSPDGQTIAFATDRGPGASFALLQFPRLRIATYDLVTKAIEVLPGQMGLNINPQWAPDGRSIAYVSDRSGEANVFLYDLDTRSHYQLTNVVGAVSAITDYSPAISWARGADRLAFTYFDDGEYTVWSIDHPRTLKGQPYRGALLPPALVAAGPLGAGPKHDSAAVAAGGERDSTEAPVSIAALLDSMPLGLPDTQAVVDRPYHVHLQPDVVARPSIGYVPDNYGANLFGGASVVLSDMLGDHQVAASAAINGRLSETQAYLAYTNLTSRLQYTIGASQSPYYFLSSDSLVPTSSPSTSLENEQIMTYVARQAFAATAYPFTRFMRLELGAGYNSVARYGTFVTREIEDDQVVAPFQLDSIRPFSTLRYVDEQLALVYDNTLFGYTGALTGQRFRLQVSPVEGAYNWVEYLLDYRRYDPIIFNQLTLATRLYGDMSFGPDADAFPKYIARSDFVRGYDRNNTSYLSCPIVGANPTNCTAVQLLGSRVAVGNIELRFPLIRRIELSAFPAPLPAVDGAFFYDAGLAWSASQTVYGSPPPDYNVATQRYPLQSYGFGLRMNLFNYAILRWDYAIPLSEGNAKGFWVWSLWPAF
jgi:Tol biopolymer transport system component